MVSHIPPLPPFLTPQEWEFFLAWLSHQFCSSCAHSQTYWHVISVFLVIHLVLVDNGPIHQALTGLSCSSLTSSLIFFHSSRTFVPIATYLCLLTFTMHCTASVLSKMLPPSISSCSSLLSQVLLLVSVLVTVCFLFLMFLPSWHSLSHWHSLLIFPFN